jgi:hypothetical protein
MKAELSVLQWVAVALASAIAGAGGLVVLIAWFADVMGDSEGAGCFAIGLALIAVAAIFTAVVVA